MEINGLANIHLIVDQALEEDNVDEFTHSLIKTQLNLLERYMLAYQDSVKKEIGSWADTGRSVDAPKWHEILQNPEKYKTLKERLDGQGKEEEAVDR